MTDLSTYNNVALRALLNESMNSYKQVKPNEIKPMEFKVCIQRKISIDRTALGNKNKHR